ncbi:tetratricopeptide repeat protein [Bdellovibrio sp. HCB337]|uniref:tetratricopeptide repeat protein n=1 Tax=Bdellovibrio sp. HCB337 TaxID=3394358 RepID=UPI0039A585B1
MSFELICSGCGAMSGPSVGICPFCKTVMASSDDKNSIQKSSIIKTYESGRLDQALSLAKKLYTNDEDSKKDADFLLLYAKILLDTEGPTSLIKGLLTEAHLLAPTHRDVLDYIELIEGKSHLKQGLNDSGEVLLKNLIRRSPQNIHAHFLLGTHLFWSEGQSQMAVPHLETCVRLSPNFLRAWGCLGVIYKKLGNAQLANRAFQKCADLELNSDMKTFFLQQIK